MKRRLAGVGMERRAEHDHVRAEHTGDREMEQGMAGVRVKRLAPRGPNRCVVHALWSVLGAVLLIALGTPTGAFASARVSPQDRAATDAYLQAQYTYDQSLLANAPASTEAAQGLASRLESECPGVLLGAPHKTLDALFESRPSGPSSPRQMGEERRLERQWTDLQEELLFSLGAAEGEPDRQAALTYAGAVRPLRWSNSAVTVLEHASAGEVEVELAARPAEICTDMTAWVASGYKTVAPVTKQLRRELEALDLPLRRVLRNVAPSLVSDPLKSYEGPREKMLVREIRTLQQRRLSAFKSLEEISARLSVTLGLVSQAETEMRGGPPKGSVEIGHGKTATGASYGVWVEPKKPASHSHRAPCPLSVGVFPSESGGATSQVIEVRGESPHACLARSRPKPPRVQCEDGDLTIEAQTLPLARTVRLHFSDGRQITSRVAIVPAKLGGPAGFYYQVVRGPSPVPVSLTEVDSHGTALRTLGLPRTGKCTEQSGGPVPGSLRTIASGSLPEGPSFSISGERFSIDGRVQFQLSLEVMGNGEGGGSASGIGEDEVLPTKPSPFAIWQSTGCRPHEYAILYGVLSAPRDTVLARSSGGLQPLRRVRIPASLHANGVLAYIALPALPSEVIVRSPTGKTVHAERFAGQAREARETCEGEAEGPA
jgi:hypothetical protein